MNYNFDKISVIDFVKILSISKGTTLRKLLNNLHSKKEYSNSYAGFYNKLKNSTLKFSEMKDIADMLGYEIIFKEKW